MTAPEIHPELQYILDAAPSRPLLGHKTLAEFRATGLSVDPKPHFPNALPPIRHQIDGQSGPVDVYEFRPSHAPNASAALLWCHGGGYVTGHGNDAWFGALFAEAAGVRVFSVDYRLAPEHPFPAARDDCWDALLFLASESASLGIAPSRIAIGGASAGGGLAAGLAIHNRDQNGPKLAFQLLLYPMLDHTHDTASGHMNVPRWPRANSMQAWEMYHADTPPHPTSAPAMAKNLTGLPPAFLSIGTADLFLDEVRQYAAHLDTAGVVQSLKTYSGVFHAAEMQGYETEIGGCMTRDYISALATALSSTAR
ncbi:alpha/beta hydrolase [Tateyamaria sp.]|uniref:alpha/beta hydrolase n=1 Tax=Tateyamaria sp. TaxID=1929288 RepID=UPI00329D7CFB